MLRSTGKSRLSNVTKQLDPVDDFMAMKRAELGLRPLEESETKSRTGANKKMGLNEFLRRFTSEDNASF